ncbi:MAG: phosphatidylglycerophosphatase A [Deltaproteobacteria bacterium]|nr:phosphatidylglycerophosphatase A [Deltaproteobacteria bacterium]
MTHNLPSKIAIFLATGMYIGYSPVAPGTLGSLLGVIICFFLSTAGPLIYGIVLFAGLTVAIWTASVAEEHLGKKDPGQIVCDEIVGYMIAMFLVPFTLFNVIIVFLLFRFFDILKPFPIRAIDEKMDKGFGIVFDDVLAGIYSNITFSFIMRMI